MAGEKTGNRTPTGQRTVGLRLIAVAGVLLAMDLLFLPWHHFSLDLGQFGVDLGGGVTIDRTGLESPKAPLGILALLLALAMVVFVAVDVVLRDRMPASSRPSWDRFPFIAGPTVLGLLLLKLMLDPEFLGLGAWLGALFGAALAYGGFLIGKQTLLASATPAAPATPQGTRSRAPVQPQPRNWLGMTRQQERWLLLAVVIVVGSLAAPWLAGTKSEVPAPPPAANAGSATTAAPSAVGSSGGVESTVAGNAGGGAETITAPPQGETTVDPARSEAGGSVTVAASGAEAGRTYVVKLDRNAEGCALSTTRLGRSVTAAEDGSISADVTIPTNMTPGPYFVCFANEADPAKRTAPAELTLT